MIDPDKMMIEKQAAIISKLREEIKYLSKECETAWAKANKRAPGDKAWHDLQDQIRANPTLEAEWDRFLGFLRMGADEDYVKRNKR